MQIARISFTGSIGAGLKVQQAATTSNLKKVVLELGGKSPAIVFDDADIPSALIGCAHAYLANAGQICNATSRLYVQERVAEGFIKSVLEVFENAVKGMGDPLDEKTTMGPLVDANHMESAIRFVELGKETATLLAGGYRVGVGVVLLRLRFSWIRKMIIRVIRRLLDRSW